MTDLRKAAKVVLDRYDIFRREDPTNNTVQTMEALRAALAAPQQPESVAWVDQSTGEQRVTPRPPAHKHPPQYAIAALAAAQQDDEHEIKLGSAEAEARCCNELSAALGWPRGISHGPLPWAELLPIVCRLRQRQPLTIEEIEAMPEAGGWWPHDRERVIQLIRDVERKHGIGVGGAE